MRIALTGTHSVGKTTLIKELSQREEFKDYHISFSNTRTLKEKGLSINCDESDGYDTTQDLVLTFHLKDLLKPNLLSDRSILDGLAYTQYLASKGKVKAETLELFGQLASTFVNNYDFIFYCPVLSELEDDGVRSLDEEFRMGVDMILSQHLVGRLPNCYTLPTDNLQENVEFILRVIQLSLENE